MPTMLPILWKTTEALAINKPAGLSTQAPGAHESVEIRLRNEPGLISGYLAFPHRLDRPVSGVLLAALTKKAARLRSQQFASRKTAKVYRALLSGQLSNRHGSLCWEDSLRKVAGEARAEPCDPTDESAKVAKTIVTVLDYDPARDVTLVRFEPITGRMHQLRLQAAMRGHPIVGDELYGGTPSRVNPSRGTRAVEASLPQIHLHAEQLSFHDPATGRRTTVSAKCPWSLSGE
ncbi:MAG: RluA family pseudouridine synthase [Planctomycetota bacterium]